MQKKGKKDASLRLNEMMGDDDDVLRTFLGPADSSGDTELCFTSTTAVGGIFDQACKTKLETYLLKEKQQGEFKYYGRFRYRSDEPEAKVMVRHVASTLRWSQKEFEHFKEALGELQAPEIPSTFMEPFRTTIDIDKLLYTNTRAAEALIGWTFQRMHDDDVLADPSNNTRVLLLGPAGPNSYIGRIRGLLPTSSANPN